MRLGIRILQPDSLLNSLSEVQTLRIVKGETTNLVVQLWNEDVGIRYIPAAGATCVFAISRYPEVFAAANNARSTIDYTIQGNATLAFPSDDRSCWTMPLTAIQTQNIATSAIMVTLTESANVKIAVKPRAITAINPMES
jgi:hypothetical protein